MTAASGLGRLRSVEIALTVLDELAAHGPMSLTQIADHVGVAKSTAHRMCMVLLDAGLLVRGADKEYFLGLKTVEYGRVALADSLIAHHGLAALSEVHCETGATVQMGVADGADVVFVHQIQSADHRRVSPVRRPVHCTSAGKVLAAWDEAVFEACLRRGMPPATRHTIVVPAVLAHELEQVREQGYARAVDELHLGWTSLAVPVRSPDGDRVVAALAMTAPSNRYRSGGERADVQRLTSAARRLRERLRVTIGAS